MDISKKFKAAFALAPGAVIIIAAGIFLLSDEDFQPYVHKVTELNGKPLSGNLFIIGNIEAELSEISEGFEDDMTLAYAEYTFRNDDDINVSFFYTKQTGESRTAALRIDVDAAEKRAVKAVYEEGIAKRVSLTYSRPLTKYKDVDIFGEYQKCVDEISISEREDLYGMPTIITVTEEKIYRLVCSESGGMTANF